jgi:hypothetical protein
VIKGGLIVVESVSIGINVGELVKRSMKRTSMGVGTSVDISVGSRIRILVGSLIETSVGIFIENRGMVEQE